MSEMMTFPDTVDEFMEQYKITDTEQVYTNGCELVPIFRMKQWFESHPEPHWIPVTERLPENSRNVLITSRGGVSMAWYNGSYFEKGASTHHRKMQTVTAWAELPEPFRSKK